MAKLIEANVTIKGTRPLLWNVFGPHSIPLEKRERSGVPGNNPDEWEDTYTATEEGQLYLDRSYIFACIKEGARYTNKLLPNKVASTLDVVEDIILFDRFMPDDKPTTDSTQPVYIDVRGVGIKATKSRHIRYRISASPGWVARFTIRWDATVVARGVMESVLLDAGTMAGLGDARKLGFGRFEIVEYRIMDGQKNA